MLIKDKRLELGMTRAQLAEKSGVHEKEIAKLERGERSLENIRLDTAIKLANALKIKNLRDLLK